VIDSSIREHTRQHKLVRVGRDGGMEEVATFATFSEGWAEGQHMVHAEPTMAFSLYRPNGQRVARFGHHRLAENDSTALLDTLVL